jgi:hypothetical protein
LDPFCGLAALPLLATVTISDASLSVPMFGVCQDDLSIVNVKGCSVGFWVLCSGDDRAE